MKFKMTHVIVLWEDAADIEDISEDTNPPRAIRSGFLVELTKKKVVIASEVFEDGTIRSRTVIPRPMVKKIWRTPVGWWRAKPR